MKEIKLTLVQADKLAAALSDLVDCENNNGDSLFESFLISVNEVSQEDPTFHEEADTVTIKPISREFNSGEWS